MRCQFDALGTRTLHVLGLEEVFNERFWKVSKSRIVANKFSISLR